MKSSMSHQSGVTLVEVLVSVLILGLAMISLAGLQSYTVKYQMGSSNRAVLSTLVSDFAERVRSNLPAAPGFAPSPVPSGYLLNASWEQQVTLPPMPSKQCNQQAACLAPEELAAWDMVVWRNRVRAELPQGSAMVSGDIRQGMTVTLMWQDNDLTVVSPVCPSSPAATQARQCCPVQQGSGVRCANFLIIP